MSDKVRNPLTGRMISTNGRIYQQLVAAGHFLGQGAEGSATLPIQLASVSPAPQIASQLASVSPMALQPVEFVPSEFERSPIVLGNGPSLQTTMTENSPNDVFFAKYLTIDSPEPLSSEEFYNIMMKERARLQAEEQDETSRILLTLTYDTLDGEYRRFNSVSLSNYKSLDIFLAFLEQLSQGQYEGKDANPWILNTGLFRISRIRTNVQPGASAKNCIFEVEDVAAHRPRKTPKKHYCVKKSLEFFGVEFDESKLADDNYSKLLDSLDRKVIYNRIVVKRSFSINMLMQGERINGRMYMPIVIGEHFGMDGPGDAKYILDLNSKDAHMDVLKQPIRLKEGFFINENMELVRFVDGKMKVIDDGIIYEKKAEAPAIKERTDVYLFFDFETHVDYSNNHLMKPYSFSAFQCSNEVLNELDEADKIKDLDTCERIRSECCKTFIGYDCADKFWDDFFVGSLDKNVHFVSFNGTTFDNLLLLKSFIIWQKKNNCEYLIDRELFAGGGLLKLRIAQRHDFFDLAKHLVGSLKGLCTGFDVKCCTKKEMDHHEMQKLADANKLIDFCESDPKLREYNEYDVLALAVIFSRYRRALSEIPAAKEYSANLHEMSTLGSLMWEILKDSIKKKYGEKGEYHLPHYNAMEQLEEYRDFEPREPVLLENSRFILPTHLDTDGNVVVDKLGHTEGIFPRLPMNVYHQMLNSKSAGRVQCFQGITKFLGEIVSWDVTSLYPYVMSILNEYYPAGNLVETGPGVFTHNKCGFYWINADQTNLQHFQSEDPNGAKGLPLILPVKVKDDRGNIIENDYNSREGIISDQLVTHKDVRQLIDNGCQVEILGGFYFTHRIKSCELFEVVLDFMKAKNHQDNLKKAKSPEYNAPLRETVKLGINSISGKVIEGLHCEKLVRVNESKLAKLVIKHDVSCVTSIGNGQYYVQYEVAEADCWKKQRPVYLGCYIYSFARAHMFNHAYKIVGLKQLLYTDTDSCKFASAHVPAVLETMKDMVVPHWPEVEAYDPKLRDHKLFDPNSKVFGSFEDELAGTYGDGTPKKNNVFYCVQKKVWLVGYLHEDGTMTDVKSAGKGFNGKSVLVPNDFEFGTQKDMQYLAAESPNRLGDDAKTADQPGANQHIFFERMFKERSATLLCTSMKKITRNTRRNVQTSQTERHQQFFCDIQVNAAIKKITIKEIVRPICTVLDSEGKICIRL